MTTNRVPRAMREAPMWTFLIRHRLTGPVWRPLVEWTRRRHVRFRQRLAHAAAGGAGMVES